MLACCTPAPPAAKAMTHTLPARWKDCVPRNISIGHWGALHEREILCDDPLIAFSGNIQGRMFERLVPKAACWLRLRTI